MATNTNLDAAKVEKFKKSRIFITSASVATASVAATGAPRRATVTAAARHCLVAGWHRGLDEQLKLGERPAGDGDARRRVLG